jgi:hypothetical protein
MKVGKITKTLSKTPFKFVWQRPVLANEKYHNYTLDLRRRAKDSSWLIPEYSGLGFGPENQ